MTCGLYIHTPFCETKCGYCDFYSVALKGRNTAPLVDAVLHELDARLAAAGRMPITTVFVGGGTPTLLPLADLERLLRRVQESIRVQDGVEFTVEANPATVDEEKARLLVTSGVTRVSMGAQSFFPAELAALERLHSPEDIAPSVDVLRRAGIGQINLDLIFGIPGQTLETWRKSLQRAIELGPDHIACYGLTYEPATVLTAQRNAGRVIPCDEDLEAEMFFLTGEVLEAAGFHQYEISNYARPGCECRHNLIYWRNQPYVGVGPSAAGCYECGMRKAEGGNPSPLPRARGRGEGYDPGVAWPSAPPPCRLRRYKNVPDIARYVQMINAAGHAEIESEFVEGETLILELILMQLRLNEGLSIRAFIERTGLDPIALFGDTLRRLVTEQLAHVSPTHVALTRSGRLVANRVMAQLAAATCLDRARGSQPA